MSFDRTPFTNHIVPMPAELWQKVQRKAFEESVKEGRRVSASELVRRAIINEFFVNEFLADTP